MEEEVRTKIRKRKPLWRRRRFWIAVAAMILGAALTVWLARQLTDYRPPME